MEENKRLKCRIYELEKEIGFKFREKIGRIGNSFFSSKVSQRIKKLSRA